MYCRNFTSAQFQQFFGDTSLGRGGEETALYWSTWGARAHPQTGEEEQRTEGKRKKCKIFRDCGAYRHHNQSFYSGSTIVFQKIPIFCARLRHLFFVFTKSSNRTIQQNNISFNWQYVAEILFKISQKIRCSKNFSPTPPAPLVFSLFYSYILMSNKYSYPIGNIHKKLYKIFARSRLLMSNKFL